jgi:hypothetical protein
MNYMEYITKQESERFEKSYKKVGDCKLWKNYLDKDGYGHFYFRKKKRRAHRVAYFMHYGAIPSGMVIDHLCKNRNCVSIEHLRLITIAENILDNSNSLGAINKRKISCKWGHPLDKKYGRQRYCSVCTKEKSSRLRKQWLEEANKVGC